VSPFAKKNFVDHTYQDHASILKFIERNWRLPKLSSRSRDNLPAPRHDDDEHRYQPMNQPAVGDLSTLFDFPSGKGLYR
jgi:phospholipase C